MVEPFVVIRTTPYGALDPYIAEEAASFRTEKLSAEDLKEILKELENLKS